MNAPANIRPARLSMLELLDALGKRRDLTMDECRAMADHAQPSQPSNVLYSRSAAELASALFAIAGKRA
jgi:hypothetical protein